MILYRSKAPFRLGIAGGGTDVSPYSELYGGAILNVTVNLYAHACIRPLDSPKVVFIDGNSGATYEYDAVSQLPLSGDMILQKGVYNAIVKDYNQGIPLALELTTSMDVPSGSGLGTSSTLMVAMLGAFCEWLALPMGRYDLAHYAVEIERRQLHMAGGKQDQYAATFGGVNFMEFYSNDRVIVNPLEISRNVLNEWAANTVLFFTDFQRESATIIEEQMANVERGEEKPLEAMHKVKAEAFRMKKALLGGRLTELGTALNVSWLNKKQMAHKVSNEFIDNIYNTAISNGALGGKISGAGGGGFLFFYCPGNSSYQVKSALDRIGMGRVWSFDFSSGGLSTWTGGKH